MLNWWAINPQGLGFRRRLLYSSSLSQGRLDWDASSNHYAGQQISRSFGFLFLGFGKTVMRIEWFNQFSNSAGGQILIGVSDSGEIKGLSGEDISRINQMISNAASQHVRPPIHPKTEIVEYENRKVIVFTVLCGANRPYCTDKGIYLTKSGADKRQISSDEMRRLFQESGQLRADETTFTNAVWDDIDSDLFFEFFEKKYKEHISDKAMIPRLFENLNLASDGKFNMSGILLFGRNVSKYFPLNQLICVSFFGDDIAGTQYRDSENIEGNVRKLFKEGMAFISRNLKKVQNGRSVNTVGEPEVPLIVFEELLVNALIHRDYFILKVG